MLLFVVVVVAAIAVDVHVVVVVVVSVVQAFLPEWAWPSCRTRSGRGGWAPCAARALRPVTMAAKGRAKPGRTRSRGATCAQ